MMTHIFKPHFAGFLFALFLLSACTVTPPEQPDGFIVGDEAPADQVRPTRQTSRAVLTLLDRANTAARDGQLSVAEVQLERALRIEPRNAVIWHYMAKLRLHQERLDQAAGLAAKSNSLDRDQNRVLQADNWRIIAHARQRKGDLQGAQDAQRRAESLLADQ